MQVSILSFSGIPKARRFFTGFLIFLAMQAAAQKKSPEPKPTVFRASMVKINITPDSPKQLLGYGARVSTGVHDSIYHRVIALDDGTTQFFIVSTDICLKAPSEYDHVAELLQKRSGIDPVNFWWSDTHTHSAPEVGPPGLGEAYMSNRYTHPVDTAYTSFVEEKLIEGITEARKRLEPARLGVGWGFSQANINRRAIDVNGRASIGLNPDGPVDRRIGLIRLDRPDGSPIALIANYPIHGTVLGPPQLEISGDVAGVVANYIEQKTGIPFVFINGAAGNMAPIYSVYPNPQAGHLNHFRVLLGDRILEANKRIYATLDSVRLFTGGMTVETPRRANLEWPAYLSNYTRTTREGMNLVRLPIRFLKINDDIAIWSAPLEMFCEIASEVRERSPFPFTFYYGYTNGWLGYLPSKEEWKYGGYEVETVSPFAPETTGLVTEAVVGFLQGEMRSIPPETPKVKKKN